ncbi:phage holin family protein [Noviherbaspirillum galbum]|uniref:Phage holin family protein n=1 Tax=Noviherbaspirillum galbum TaxID=2709383 RepID=A0A6B3SRN0_9BURK|nr:phage holin family protein [Noviherbaspirillum galbum]NEX63301.1 phage holin family protein [Noviherbaspirillum galbum]
MQPENQGQEARPGLVHGVSGLARNAFALFVSRVELAALEMGEVRDNLARLVIVGVLGTIALCFALACWTALVVALCWDAMGWKILLLVAVVYTVLAALILLRARSLLSPDSLSLPATLAELRGDRDALM